MKVLLTTLNAKYIHINLAIRLLYDLNKGHEGLAWKEFTIKENPDEIAKQCTDFEVIAFSCYIWNITQTLAVAKRIKSRNPHAKILLGGPEVSYEWEDVMAHDCVDFIIVGEGEIPFSQFLRDYPQVSHIPGLVFRTENGIQENRAPATFDVNLFAEVYPYQYDPVEELNAKVLYLETSRGCPYKCEFCLASLDNKVRYLPMHNIKSNLLYLMQNGRTIKFLDRTFNMKRDFTLEVFAFILENYRPENVFQFEITADILHPDIIQFINEKVPKNLFRFEIGIQTVNQNANLEVSRRQNFEKTKRIIRAVEDKVELHLDLIVGMALDYWGDIRYSFEEVFKLFAPELQMGFLKFLKGTPVRHKAEKHGFVFDPNPPYQIIRSNYLSETELEQLIWVENALEIYWNKNRARNTLKYITAHYSIFDFLQGLGAYFRTQKDFHKYDIPDVFTILTDYATTHFPEDNILLELIAIDYYLFHKVKPKPLFKAEIDKALKFKILYEKKLNPNKFRYMIFSLGFDFATFHQNNTIQNVPAHLIVQYDGIDKAKVLF